MQVVKTFVAACLFSVLSLHSATTQYVHAKGQQILDAGGKPLLLHGIDLGNWMVPEGYMWHFDGGPQSTREIEEFVDWGPPSKCHM